MVHIWYSFKQKHHAWCNHTNIFLMDAFADFVISSSAIYVRFNQEQK